MALSTLKQVWQHAPMAERVLKRDYGLDVHTAADVVQDVLLRFLRKAPEHLDFPKAYLLQACGWRALEVLRRRRNQAKALQALWDRRPKEVVEPEVLVALEDEDKPKFFGQATPKQREVLDLLLEGHDQKAASVILGIPGSTLRMRIHLARKRLGAA